MKNIELYNGVQMPLEGFGVFQVPDAKEAEEVTYNAIKVGSIFFKSHELF